MSKLKISENLFLDVNELNHFSRFLKEDGYKKILKNIVNNYGIVQNSNNDNFIVEKIDDNSVIVNPGLAFNEDLDAIVLKEQKTLNLLNNVEHYICIKYSTTNIEEGTIDLTQNGEIIGNGTLFTDVLRGQPNFPTKIKFQNSLNNTEEYEVINVSSDTQALISGNFVAENNLKYSVVGTFTPGAVIDTVNKEIYEYDSCEIFVIDGSEPILNDGEYFLSKITYNNNILFIEDIRYRNMFNLPGIYPQNVISLINLVNVNPKGLSEFTINSVNHSYAEYELLIEFSSIISSFTLNGNTFTITGIISNKYSSVSNIPDGAFNNCILYNKSNGKKVLILNSVAGVCTLSESISIDGNSELYILPNANEIEFEIKNNSQGGINSDIPIHIISKIEDCKCICKLSSELGQNNPIIEIRYRLIGINNSSNYLEIENCNYMDYIDEISKIYIQGGITVNINSFNS